VHRSRSVRRAEVITDGRNLVSHAGTALLSELADRTVVGPAARRRGRGRLGRAAQVGRPDAAVGGWELEQERPNDARSVAIAALRSTTPRQVAAEDPAAPSRLITPVNSMGTSIWRAGLACSGRRLKVAKWPPALWPTATTRSVPTSLVQALRHRASGEPADISCASLTCCMVRDLGWQYRHPRPVGPTAGLLEHVRRAEVFRIRSTVLTRAGDDGGTRDRDRVT
jgi:hypothetical protein